MMKKEVEKMIDDIVRKFGFESEHAIGFCMAVEEFEKGHLTIGSISAQYKWAMRQ
jgi:hypothetical protein